MDETTPEGAAYLEGRLGMLEEIVGRLLQAIPSGRSELREISSGLKYVERGAEHVEPFLKGSRRTLEAVQGHAGFLPET